jgi:hypothetical protein
VSTGSVRPKLSEGIIFFGWGHSRTRHRKIDVDRILPNLECACFSILESPLQITAFIENLPVGEQVTARVSLETAEGVQLAFAGGQLKLDTLIEPTAQFELHRERML